MLGIQRSLAFVPLFLWFVGQFSPAEAQIISDDTLGAESSQLRRQSNQITIEGGSDRAPILFHSFEQFNIADDQQVIFANPQGINTILSRVTGNTPSEINGTLGVSGPADLFLLNPNGILFGPNAQLNMTGRFTASTADSIRVDDFDFSAVNPAPVPLLTLNVTPGLQLGTNAPDRLIQNNGHLRLEREQALTFDAGTIHQSGQIRIPAGTVQLQGDTIQLTGTVDTHAGGDKVGTLHVRSPSDLTIQPTGPLTNQAISDALQTNEVVVESDRTLTLRGTLTSTSTSTNPLTLRAGRTLRLLATDGVESGREVSEFRGDVALQSDGRILIENPIHQTRTQTPQLTIQAGGRVRIRANELTEPPETLESNRVRMLQLMGNGGSLSITANNLKIENTAIRTIAEEGNTGPTLELHLIRNLVLKNSQVDTRFGFGEQSGDLTVRVGRSLNAFNSTINTGFFRDESNGVTPNIFGGIPDIVSDDISDTSQTGDLHLDVGDTLLLEGSQIRTTSFRGDAGNISVFARRLILDGSDQVSIISPDTNLGSTGNAGAIEIHTQDSVELIGNEPGPFVPPTADEFSVAEFLDIVFNSTVIAAPSLGTGQSSPITIRTQLLHLKDGGFVGNAAGVFGEGGISADLTVMANDIRLQGNSGIGSLALGNGEGGNIFVESDRLILEDGAILAVSSLLSTGSAGILDINTNQLIVSSGAIVAANTEEGGRGGILNIRAHSILIDGTSADGSVPSTLRTNVSPGASGQGRALRIQTDRLQVLNGAEIRAGTQSTPDAGNITINANHVIVDGVGLGGQPSMIQTESALPPDGANENLENENLELGAAGNITLNADRLTVSDRATLSTRSQQGDGGDMRLVLDDYVLLRRGGQISATAGVPGTGGDGGNIDIDAGFIIAPIDEDSDITANAFKGAGGNITLRTNALLLGIALRDQPTGFSDITASSESGLAGTVTIEGIVDDLAPTPLQLPSGVASSEDRLVAGCLLDEDANFVVTGRGGIPANPSERLNQALIWQDPRLNTDGTGRVLEESIHPKEVETPELSEAQGWRVNEYGQTELMASLTFVMPHSRSNC